MTKEIIPRYQTHSIPPRGMDLNNLYNDIREYVKGSQSQVTALITDSIGPTVKDPKACSSAVANIACARLQLLNPDEISLHVQQNPQQNNFFVTGVSCLRRTDEGKCLLIDGRCIFQIGDMKTQ